MKYQPLAILCVCLSVCGCFHTLDGVQSNLQTSSLKYDLMTKAARARRIIPIYIERSSQDKEFGRTATKPIPTGSIPSSYVYLRLLRDDDGLPYLFERYGSMRNPNDTRLLMDKYKLTRARSGQSFDLYLDPYNISRDNSVEAPFATGFIKDLDYAEAYDEALKLLLEGKKGKARNKFLQMQDDTYYAAVNLSILAAAEGNVAEDYQWRKKAADMGHIASYCALGVYYQQGIGTDKDAAAGFRRHKECADKYELPLSQLSTAKAYHYGEGTSKSTGKALLYAEKAARAGIRPAMLVYADILLTGDKKTEACAWLKLYNDSGKDNIALKSFCDKTAAQSDRIFMRLKKEIVIDKRFLENH